MGAGINISQQHIRSRTWWSLYALEQLLGDFTGRPTSILDSDIAIPLDVAKESEEASPRSPGFSLPEAAQQVLLDRPPAGLRALQYPSHPYFVWRVRLSILGHRIRSLLYSSSQMSKTWSRFQQSIREFDQQLTQWSAELPKDLRLSWGVDIQSAERYGGQLLDRFELAMSYQSTRMILFRPCLCHLDGVIPHESALSRNFNQEAAVACVSAARNMLSLLPDEAINAHASKMLPWWSLLHYINQAGAVLLLELCLKGDHMPSQVDQLFTDIGKIMRWLAEMAADSLSAWRSWKIFRKLSLQAAASVGVEVIFPEDVQKPPGWKPAYEQLLSPSLTVPLNQQADMQMLGAGHSHEQAEQIPPSDMSNAMFPIAVGADPDSWNPGHFSNMPSLPGDLAYSSQQQGQEQQHQPYSQSTGGSGGEMDWSR